MRVLRPFRLPVPEYPPLPRFHLPLIEPGVRICRTRLSDGIRQAGPQGGALRRPFAGPLARSARPDPCLEVLGTMATLRVVATSRALPKSGPFPPPALPGLDSTMGLSDSPPGRACPSRASRWQPLLPPLGPPVLRSFSLCRHASATTPAGPSPGSGCSPDGDGGGLPHVTAGSAPALVDFEACSAFTHVLAYLLAGSPERPFASKASAVSLPPRPLRLLRAGATVARWELHPLKNDAFHGARTNSVCRTGASLRDPGAQRHSTGGPRPGPAAWWRVAVLLRLSVASYLGTTSSGEASNTARWRCDCAP